MNSHQEIAAFRAHFHETQQTEQQYVKISHTEFRTNSNKSEKRILKQSMASAIFKKRSPTVLRNYRITSYVQIGRKNITNFFRLSVELRCDIWSINMESTDSNALTLLRNVLLSMSQFLYLIIISRLLSWRGANKQQIYFQIEYSDSVQTWKKGKPCILRDAE